MARLTDADDAYKVLTDNYHHKTEIQHEALKEALSKVPTVDAVEVVRCKDCKFFDHDDFGKGEEYWCKHFVSTYDNTHCHKVMEDDFCAWAERRKDG